MKRKHLLLTLLLAFAVPLAMNAQSSLPYSENFQFTNLNSLPSGWTLYQTVGTGDVVVQKETITGSNKVLAFLMTSIEGNSGGVSVLMPRNSSGVTFMKMSFRLKPFSTTSGTFKIGYLSGVNNTFTTLATYEASSGVSWNSITLPITLPSNNRLLLSMITRTANTGWIVDDIVITDGYRPTNVSSSNIGDDAATITWDNNDASKWQIRYKLSSESSWTTVSGTQSTTSYMFSDLLAGTSYDVQVRAKAATGNFYSSWSETCTFTTTGCAIPTNVQVYANPVEGVTVSWEGNASSYHIQYENIETFQSGYHNGLVTTTGNSYTFNGTEPVPVLPGMRYILRVKAQCDPSTASEWSDWVEFTDCLTYTNLPLHANFDYIPTTWTSLPHADLPGCWTRINSSTDPDYSIYPLVESNQSLCHSGYYNQGFFNYIRFNMPVDGSDQYLVFPAIDAVSADGVEISFWVRSVGSGSLYNYVVGLAQDPISVVETFWSAGGYNEGGYATTYHQMTFTFTQQDLNEHGNYLVIWAPAADNAPVSFCIDDIDIYPNGYHCDEPVNVHAENIGATSAQIVWQNPISGGGEWGLKYKRASDAEWTVVTETGIVSLHYPLENLDANTLYDVAVINNCNSVDHSEWVETSFTTLGMTPIPTNLAVDLAHTGNSWVTFTWDCTPGIGQNAVSKYNIEISEDGQNWHGGDWTPYTMWWTVNQSLTINSIDRGQHYFHVQVVDDQNNEGDWSEPQPFTIEGCETVTTISSENNARAYGFYSTYLPNCWTITGDRPDRVTTEEHALGFKANGGNVAATCVELEQIQVTDDFIGLVVSFDWRHLVQDNNNTTNVTVQLQYCLGTGNENWQDAGDPISLFKEMGEPYYSTENYTRIIPYGYWTRLRFKFTETDYQAFNYGVWPMCAITNLVLTGRPYCANPSELSIVPSTYGGRVIWEKVDAAVSYDIKYQVVGTVEWNTIEDVEGYVYDADHLFFDLTGMQANTTYRVNMKSECSDQWPTDPVTFTTSDYGSFNELMYTFEEGMPADFSVTGAGAENVSVSTEQSFGGDSHSLKYNFVSGSPYPSQAIAYVEIGNKLNTHDFTDFLVYFDMYCTDVTNTYESVYLQYKTFGSDGWEENWRSAGTWYTSYDSQGWVERYATFSIPTELQGSVSKMRFRLVFTDHGSGENTYIDNIRIFPKGSCQNVNTSSQFFVDNVTSTTVTFHWTDPNYDATASPVAHSEGFTVRYRNLTIPTNTNTGWIEENVWVDDSNATAQYSLTLNNLDPSSYYVIDIRTLCPDGGYTQWSTPHQPFATECQPYELKDMEPFVEDFNDIDLACWTYNTRWGRIYDGHSGSNWSLRSNKINVSGWNDYIDTPEIEMNSNYVNKSSSYLVLRFWTKCSGEDGTGNKVKVMVGDQETEIYELPANKCNEWQLVHLSLSRFLPSTGSNIIRVRFDHESNATAEWFIDDVMITSWDEANYGTRIFDDAVSNDRDWTNDNNWYPNGAPTYSPSMNVTLMGTAWVPNNSNSTVGTMRFSTQGYLDVQPGGNLTVAEVDIPDNKVNVEAGGTLNIGTAHFGFDKVFTNAEGTYNITNLNVDDHWLNFNSGNVSLGTVTVTAPGRITVTNTLNATTVNSSGMFEVYPDAAVTIGTLNAAEGSPINVLIEGTANIGTLNPGGANSVIVNDGGLLNATTITTANAGANDRVVILDGGQVKTENTFYATIEKDITGYGIENVYDNSGWYLVAPPTVVMAVQTFVPQIGSEYQFDQIDFYWFDGHQELEWYNPKCPAEGGCESPWGIIPQGHFSAEVGQPLKGYLYARQDDGTLQFAAGAVGNNPFPATNVNTSVNLEFYSNNDAPLNGWNLIGNPYTCNAYLIDENDEIMPFYRMNDAGDAIVAAQPGTAIKPCEGVFVVCPGDGQLHQAIFTTTAPATVGETQDDPDIVIPVHTLLGDQDASIFTTITQTITLSAGWNWFSTYIEGDPNELLEKLETSLGDNGLTIESQYDGFTENMGIWFGDLDDVGISNEQMYLIETSTACTIHLHGLPADPADHPIYIYPGWNWIGFPCTQVVSIDEAFANFEIGDEDIIEGAEGYSEVIFGEWFGDVEELNPGQGYYYYSSSEDVKELVFETGAKASRVLGNFNPANTMNGVFKPIKLMNGNFRPIKAMNGNFGPVKEMKKVSNQTRQSTH